ncbi:BP74-related protein [Actinomadura macra]|uniref:BP74-related protein n=1 Tax=Actinomadura macra TaxID=46164 RepID=UPI001FE20DD8|nr:calmodulin [Actinomadura macra]
MLGAVAVAVALTLPLAPAAHAEEAAYFEFTTYGVGGPENNKSIFKLTDPVKIQHARSILNGTETQRPHVIGRIKKTPAPYNPRWSFHLNPDTIDFFDAAMEVCDATTSYVEEHLAEAGGAFLPGLVWCPWTSRLVREVTPR